MEWLVWTGAVITVLGCVGLILSVVLIARARAEGLEDEALRARIQKVIPINLAALFVATIGLMIVIVAVDVIGARLRERLNRGTVRSKGVGRSGLSVILPTLDNDLRKRAVCTRTVQAPDNFHHEGGSVRKESDASARDHSISAGNSLQHTDGYLGSAKSAHGRPRSGRC